jgi:hypothetical protein
MVGAAGRPGKKNNCEATGTKRRSKVLDMKKFSRGFPSTRPAQGVAREASSHVPAKVVKELATRTIARMAWAGCLFLIATSLARAGGDGKSVFDHFLLDVPDSKQPRPIDSDPPPVVDLRKSQTSI